MVLNILKITSGTGLFILIVGFRDRHGPKVIGPLEPVRGCRALVIGFVAAFLCLFGWPTILSFFTTAVTAMGYYIYNQNTLRTSGVLEGFQNIDLDSAGGTQCHHCPNIDFRGNFITSQGIIWNLIYLVSIGLGGDRFLQLLFGGFGRGIRKGKLSSFSRRWAGSSSFLESQLLSMSSSPRGPTRSEASRSSRAKP